MQLTIDQGTIILVAEILKAERGAAQVDVDDATRAIIEVIEKLRVSGATIEDCDENEDL